MLSEHAFIKIIQGPYNRRVIVCAKEVMFWGVFVCVSVGLFVMFAVTPKLMNVCLFIFHVGRAWPKEEMVCTKKTSRMTLHPPLKICHE